MPILTDPKVFDPLTESELATIIDTRASPDFFRECAKLEIVAASSLLFDAGLDASPVAILAVASDPQLAKAVQATARKPRLPSYHSSLAMMLPEQRRGVLGTASEILGTKR